MIGKLLGQRGSRRPRVTPISRAIRCASPPSGSPRASPKTCCKSPGATPCGFPIFRSAIETRPLHRRRLAVPSPANTALRLRPLRTDALLALFSPSASRAAIRSPVAASSLSHSDLRVVGHEFRPFPGAADLDVERLLVGEFGVIGLHRGDDVIDRPPLEGVYGRGPCAVDVAKLGDRRSSCRGRARPRRGR